MSRVLLTGGTGFIGGAVGRRLASEGATVGLLSRRPAHSGAGDREYVLGEAPWSAAAIGAAIADFAPDAILHLVGGPASGSMEALYERNVFLSERLIAAASGAAPDAQVLLVGSAAEYGVPLGPDGLSREEDACSPVGAYGIAKLAQTLHGLAAARQGQPIVVARLFNPVGPGMPAGLAFSDLASRLAARPETLPVGDIDAARDFLSVDEAARILCALVREPRAIGKVVNVCSGVASPVRAALDRMIARVGRPVSLVDDPAQKPSPVKRIRGDTTLLRSLGIEPARPDIGDAIDAMVDEALAAAKSAPSRRASAMSAAEREGGSDQPTATLATPEAGAADPPTVVGDTHSSGGPTRELEARIRFLEEALAEQEAAVRTLTDQAGRQADEIARSKQDAERERAAARRERQAVAAVEEARDWHARQAANWERAYADAVRDLQPGADRELTAARISELRRQIEGLRDGPLGGVKRQARRVGKAVRHPLLASKLLTRAAIVRIGRRWPTLGARLDHGSRRLWRRISGRRMPASLPRPGSSAAGDSSSMPLLRGARSVVFDVAPHPADLPLVSIVIPCFNYGRFIHEAVASAKAQTFSRIEIIVVDGGSTDGSTPAIVAALSGANVRVLLREGRHRVGSNRNFGIEQARGKYVCCLDADDRIDPTYVEKAVFLMEAGGYDVASTAVQMFGEENARFGVAEHVDLDLLLERNEVATCALFRRELWSRAGGYRDHGDGTPGTHIHEDWEFWIRLAAAGARFVNIAGEYLFHYRTHAGPSLSRSEEILPMAQQRLTLHGLTADVVNPDAIARSVASRWSTWIARDKLVNLTERPEPPPQGLVIALPWMVIGGAERLLSAIAASLAARGWDLSVVTTLDPDPSGGDTAEWFAAATPRIYQLPRFLAQEQWPDFFDYLIGGRGVRRLLIAGSRFAYEALPHLKAKYPDLKVYDLLFNTEGHTGSNRRFASFIDRTLVENHEVRDWLVREGERPERIATIPSGVDVKAFVREEGRGQLREALGLKPSDLLVGYCGRWSREKNPLGFIEIAERLTDNPRIHFVMTGAGQMGDEIARRIGRSASLDGRFHLLGRIEQITTVLSDLDVLLVPSTVDGRPVVILEAMASGVAVVASAVGGIPELVKPGDNGELCRPGDVREFATAVIALEADRPRLARYKVRAREFAAENLDAEVMLDAYARTLGA